TRCMYAAPATSTPHPTLFPYTTLFRSQAGRRTSRASAGARSCPKVLQIEIQRFERLGAHALLAAVRREGHPAIVLEAEDLQRPRLGIDDPRVGHAVPRVERHLHGPIDMRSARRGDLADPVGHHAKAMILGHFRHAFPAPAGQVGYSDLQIGSRTEVD